MKKRSICYRLARPTIRDGDLLLFRSGRRLMSRLIARAGRSEYSHAGMAAWWNSRLMCLDTIQGQGGRAVLLSNLVREFPGQIDIYATKTIGEPFDRRAAVEAMIEVTGRRYGWWALARAALFHLAVVRLFVRPNTEDTADGSLPFCSQAVARALRAGGVDAVPNLADAGTEPSDLARSAFLRYRYTLVSTEIEAKR